MATISCGSADSHAHLFVVKDGDGNVIDLTDYDVAVVLTRGTRVVTLTESDFLSVTNPTAGEVLMSWDAGYAPLRGQYRGKMTLAKTGRHFQSASFPNVYIT